MTSEDDQVRAAGCRRLVGWGLVIALLAAGLLVAVLLTREDSNVGVTASTLPQSSAKASPTSATLDTRTEVVGRLRSILGIRDKAFRDRDPEILKDIYTVDCPCLEGDRNAIEELTTNNYHVVGGATSIRVRKVDRVNEQLWLVVADFQSAPLRIEAEDNRLIRKEPGGKDLFQFALSKPAGSRDWRLGRATAYREKS
jgi:hypothetical protein